MEPEQRKLQRKQKYFFDTFQSKDPGSVWDQFMEPVQPRHVEEVFSALMQFFSKPISFPFRVLHELNQKACQCIKDPKTFALWRFVETLFTTIVQNREFHFCQLWLQHFSNESLVKGSPTTLPTDMMNCSTVHFLLTEFAEQCNLFVGAELFMSYAGFFTDKDCSNRMHAVRQTWLSNPRYQPTFSPPEVEEFLRRIYSEGETQIFSSEWIVFILGWYAKQLTQWVLKWARVLSLCTRFDLIFDRLWNPIVVNVDTICWQDLQEATNRRKNKVEFLHRDVSSVLDDYIQDRNLHPIISNYIYPPLLKNQIVFNPPLNTSVRPIIHARIKRIFGS